jgi:nitrogen fixation protein FixH
MCFGRYRHNINMIRTLIIILNVLFFKIIIGVNMSVSVLCLMSVSCFIFCYILQVGFHSGRKTYIQRRESARYIQESLKNMGQMD